MSPEARVRSGPVVGLTVVRNEGEAEVVCGMLQANGIPCSYRQAFSQETVGGRDGGQQAIFVAQRDAKRARKLLEGDQASRHSGSHGQAGVHREGAVQQVVTGDVLVGLGRGVLRLLGLALRLFEWR